ncbi:MAG: TonB-dependent receptor plug domain-containing protein, partial [Flavobacteriales bacterium]|nr:TonB-dependent receptor plug domain-containing protein [Flavobacteriales bacterium]
MRFIHKLNLLFFGLCLISLHGQTIRVVDAVTGYPIEDVVAYDTLTKNNTTSDADGQLDLSVFSADNEVFFEHIGYERLIAVVSEVQLSKQISLYPDTQRLGEIVLSVSRTKDEKKRVSKQVAILSDRDIVSIVPNTSAELLREAPGIRIQRSQGGGGSPVIRGFEANRILLVVDGVRMNNAIYRSGHLHNAISIDPFSLSRAEVVYGPSSVGYGADALGGVVHYFTKEPRVGDAQPWRFFIANSYDIRHENSISHVDITHSNDKWASLTSASYSIFGDIYMGRQRNHGYPDWGLVSEISKNNRYFFQDQPQSNPNPNRQFNTKYDQIYLMQKLVFQQNAENKWVLNFQYSESSDIPRFDKLAERMDDELRYATWFYGPQKRLLISPKYSFTSYKKWLREGVITLAYQKIEESRVHRKFGSLLRESQIEDLDVFSANADFSVALDPSKKLAYGFEMTHNELTSIGYSQNLVVDGNTIIGLTDFTLIPSRYPSKGGYYTTLAAYVDYKWNLDEKNTLNAGARLTNTRLKAEWSERALVDSRLGKTTNKSNALN